VGKQQYQIQIHAMRQLIAHLNQFDAEVQNAVNGYRLKLSSMVDQGLPEEVHRKFMSDFYPQSKAMADKNSSIVKDMAIPFLAHNIQGLEQLI